MSDGSSAGVPGDATGVPGDSKDWTWVLHTPCPECGFDASMFGHDDVASMIRTNSREWVDILGGDDVEVRARPERGVWSALEYGCHVRDVHRLYLERLELMLAEDGPSFADWDQDVTAVESRYDLADPATVSDELVAAGEMLATRFESVSDSDVSGDQWGRTGFRSDGADFTIDSFARYFIHDPIHHVWDVRSRSTRPSSTAPPA